MADKKLNETYYQPDYLGTGSKAIKELKSRLYQKRCQVMVSKVKVLASLYVTIQGNKTPLLWYDKIKSAALVWYALCTS